MYLSKKCHEKSFGCLNSKWRHFFLTIACFLAKKQQKSCIDLWKMAPFTKLDVIEYCTSFSTSFSRSKHTKIQFWCSLHDLRKKGKFFTFLMTFWDFVAIFYWNSSSHIWKNGAIFLSGAFRDFIDEIFKKYTIKPF